MEKSGGSSKGLITMRYEKGHKEATRKRIVAVASKRFREDGVAAVGIAGLMANADLTHGGFYSHFASKEDLVGDAVAEALDDTLGVLRTEAEQRGGLEGIIRAYLRPAHRDHPGEGCAVAALAAELARHPAATREALSQRLPRFVELIAEHLPGSDAEARRDCAVAIFGAMVGTLQLARLVSDSVESDRVLANGAVAARALATGCQEHFGA
jgi:TetR/AcrR family transcriptional repressor of nem operon